MSIIGSAVSDLLYGSGDSFSWQDKLHPASFRGVPFAVESGDGIFGRRQAVHEYPYRDSVWVEDMGRATRRLHLTGFIVQGSRVYTAGDVMSQRNALIAAAETAGSGTLVHPTLGELTVSVMEGGLRIHEHKDEGRMFRFTLTVIESGLKVFAVTGATDASSLVKTSWLTMATTAAARMISEVKGDLRSLSQTVKTLKSTAQFWTSMVKSTISQATNLGNVLKSTFGSSRYGRYNTGSVGGNASGTTTSAVNSDDTGDYKGLVATRMAQGVQSRAAVSTATDAVMASNDVESFAANVKSVIVIILASPAGGADLINTLESLAGFTDKTYRQDPHDSAVATIAQIYINAMIAGAMVYAASLYTPANYDEASALTKRVSDVMDAAILLVADAGYDDLYSDMMTLRTNFVNTMTVNGANLSTVQSVTFNRPLPALTIANRLYQDADRTESLVKMANPVHPAFMPTSFKALSS
ncbi:DNA circularization protein [Pantoea ananatis]|uniref:DNA circularization protein n=1 Tax=Pantoea ananas TaxID=553 RepID=UPI003C286D1B